MRVEEFRIGNWVEDIVSYRFVKIDGIESNHDVIWVDYKDGSAQYDLNLLNLKPIELTEEILLKCGFVKEDLKPSNKHSNYFSIWINDYKYSFSFAYFREDWGFYHSYTDALREEDNNKFDAISFGIKYLHQLQNLYFALNGKELEINL